MSYTSRYGKRPNEYAGKTSHTHIIKDQEVKKFIELCTLPTKSVDVEISNEILFLKPPAKNSIKYIFAIDGGYSEVAVRKDFPSAKLALFNFGLLNIELSDLENISKMKFIGPEDMQKLKELERVKLVLPTKTIALKKADDLITSVRMTIFDFFTNQLEAEKNKLIETLKWLIYEEYDKGIDEYQLASCPICNTNRIILNKHNMSNDYTFSCTCCKGEIYLTDIFRLHEAIDNELGASGILGYLCTLIEQMLLVNLIKAILYLKPSLLNEILFIKDGPLAFFGQTANMHKPVRRLTNYLFKNHNLHLAGLDKSGSFVEHAIEIENRLEPGQIHLIDNEYIYKYIIPGTADPSQPYARTSYYGTKLIYKAFDERVYVVTLPTEDESVVLSPTLNDFKNIDVILSNIERLKCDMYDSALVPIALVNKLVSLADRPSSLILEKFVKKTIDKN